MNNFDKIETYLFNTMEAADKAAFEQELAQNNDLKAEVEQRRLEHRSMELSVRDDLRAQMNAWAAEDETSSVAPAPMQVSFIRRNLFKMAAAATVLLVVGFFSRTLFSPTGEVDALAYMDSTTRSSGSLDGVPAVFHPGLTALKAGQYDAAIGAFAQVTDAGYRPQALLYTGECYFRQKQYDAAINTFQTVENTPTATEEQHQTAQWFRFLTLKAAGRKEVAEQLRKEIAGMDGHVFGEEAKKMK